MATETVAKVGLGARIAQRHYFRKYEARARVLETAANEPKESANRARLYFQAGGFREDAANAAETMSRHPKFSKPYGEAFKEQLRMAGTDYQKASDYYRQIKRPINALESKIRQAEVTYRLGEIDKSTALRKEAAELRKGL